MTIWAPGGDWDTTVIRLRDQSTLDAPKGWLSGIRGGRFTGAADWCLPVNAHYPSTTVAAVAPAKSMVIDWKNPGKKTPDGRGFNELSVAVVTEPR